jgi:hypothetical protein
MSEGLTQRRNGAGAAGSSAPAQRSVRDVTVAASTSYFSSNVSKRRGEIFFLGWGAVWISIMATIVATRMFEVSRLQAAVWYCDRELL